MRILTLANSPLDRRNGSGYVICGYAEGLRKLGHTVDLLGPADFEPWFGARRAIRHRQAVGMAIQCRRRLAHDGYDVVEIYGAEGWLGMSLLALRRKRPFLLVAHSNGLETHCLEVLRVAGLDSSRWFQPDLPRLSELAFRRADALVTVSDWDAAWAIEHGYQPAARVLSLDNPLPESYIGLDPEFGRNNEIGFCGSWSAIKGIALLQRDMLRVLREFPSWRLTLVGVGDGFRLEDHFPEDVQARVAVVSRSDRETELLKLYQRFAILVLPSIYESFGLVVAEAMACGVAVVASPVGFAAALANDYEVLHLAGGEAPLAEAVRRLILDETLRDRIARGGYARAQENRWEPAVSRLAEAYQQWLHEGRSRSSGNRITT